MIKRIAIIYEGEKPINILEVKDLTTDELIRLKDKAEKNLNAKIEKERLEKAKLESRLVELENSLSGAYEQIDLLKGEIKYLKGEEDEEESN